MTLFISILVLFLLSCIIISEHKKVIRMEAELSYVTGKLKEIMRTQEFEYIMIPTEYAGVQNVTAEINRLLSKYFRAQIKHKKSEESLMKMMVNISHDLRTPLTVLKGYTEILYGKVNPNEMPNEVYQLIQKLAKKTYESVRMVTQFFEMTKLESGDMVFDIQKLNICGICGETIMEYFDLLTEQGYIVDIAIPESPIYIKADRNACVRILKNLIDNALKYGEEGKFLGLKVQKINEHVSVSVEDHGKGVEESEKELIFSRTYMQDKDGGQAFQSSGLGLSISKELAKHMDADINVISQSYKSTIFTVTFKKL